MNSMSEMRVAVVVATPGERGRNCVYWIVPKVNQVTKMPTMKPQSPTRLVMKAFLAAEALAGLSNQNEMRKYEQTPTPSQPRNVSNRLLPSTSITIEKTKRFR